MSKVLELTDGITGTIADGFYPKEEVELYNPFVEPGKLPYDDGELKGIFAHFVLQKFHWRESVKAVEDWSRCIEDEGLLHIIVPSRRWIARAMLQEKIEPVVAPLLFGDEELPHMSLFAISDLRAIIDSVGMRCIKAKVGKVVLQVGEEQYTAEQLYIVGQKDQYIEETKTFV